MLMLLKRYLKTRYIESTCYRERDARWILSGWTNSPSEPTRRRSSRRRKPAVRHASSGSSGDRQSVARRHPAPGVYGLMVGGFEMTVLNDDRNRDSLEPNDQVQTALCTPTRAG